MHSSYDIYINGAQLVLIDTRLPTGEKQDILQSGLLAQLISNKAPHATVGEWRHEYGIGLSHMQWLRTATSTEDLPLPNKTFTLLELLRNTLAVPPYKNEVLAAFNRLTKSLNESARLALQAAVGKTTDAAQRKGVWIELVVVRSATNLFARNLTLENIECPSGEDWLNHKLNSPGMAENYLVQTNGFQLKTDYAKVRTKVQNTLGHWPEKMTVPVLAAPEEPDNLLLPDRD
ncbi:hypothetical protein HFV04_005060 [Pseudomonas sp. BIGb0427]|uniref:hypothetical protein n=1 Tax=unclassified Pseudomonas TaxID=196821 RepID=UPI0018A77A6F|nr:MULTISPECIES: hypothetical protein [unclassified Pseudomonas]QPG64139.1 hypothetical protein HFV04_005060 [Pseudomonas sp. BIGb0427]UVM66565.1 hypothetical protein LOY34_25300 [Pseudomonas sp. B21-009]